jgi:small-conductance mechanosensitive channel
MIETVNNIGWSIVFVLVGGLVGMALVILFSFLAPRLIDRMTPHIDEQKEIARGNTAVAEYFGRIVGATIIGLSIVAAAAVLGGIMAALH